MKHIKTWRTPLAALALLLVILLSGCDSSGGAGNGLTIKDLPAGWSAANGGIAYDGTERECFYIAEDALANQNFQYVTDVAFADQKRGIAALVFQSSEDGKNCYVAKRWTPAQIRPVSIRLSTAWSCPWALM